MAESVTDMAKERQDLIDELDALVLSFRNAMIQAEGARHESLPTVDADTLQQISRAMHNFVKDGRIYDEQYNANIMKQQQKLHDRAVQAIKAQKDAEDAAQSAKESATRSANELQSVISIADLAKQRSIEISNTNEVLKNKVSDLEQQLKAFQQASQTHEQDKEEAVAVVQKELLETKADVRLKVLKARQEGIDSVRQDYDDKLNDKSAALEASTRDNFEKFMASAAKAHTDELHDTVLAAKEAFTEGCTAIGDQTLLLSSMNPQWSNHQRQFAAAVEKLEQLYSGLDISEVATKQDIQNAFEDVKTLLNPKPFRFPRSSEPGSTRAAEEHFDDVVLPPIQEQPSPARGLPLRRPKPLDSSALTGVGSQLTSAHNAPQPSRKHQMASSPSVSAQPDRKKATGPMSETSLSGKAISPERSADPQSKGKGKAMSSDFSSEPTDSTDQAGSEKSTLPPLNDIAQEWDLARAIPSEVENWVIPNTIDDENIIDLMKKYNLLGPKLIFLQDLEAYLAHDTVVGHLSSGEPFDQARQNLEDERQSLLDTAKPFQEGLVDPVDQWLLDLIPRLHNSIKTVCSGLAHSKTLDRDTPVAVLSRDRDNLQVQAEQYLKLHKLATNEEDMPKGFITHTKADESKLPQAPDEASLAAELKRLDKLIEDPTRHRKATQSSRAHEVVPSVAGPRTIRHSASRQTLQPTVDTSVSSASTITPARSTTSARTLQHSSSRQTLQPDPQEMSASTAGRVSPARQLRPSASTQTLGRSSTVIPPSGATPRPSPSLSDMRRGGSLRIKRPTTAAQTSASAAQPHRRISATISSDEVDTWRNSLTDSDINKLFNTDAVLASEATSWARRWTQLTAAQGYKSKPAPEVAKTLDKFAVGQTSGPQYRTNLCIGTKLPRVTIEPGQPDSDLKDDCQYHGIGVASSEGFPCCYVEFAPGVQEPVTRDSRTQKAKPLEAGNFDPTRQAVNGVRWVLKFRRVTATTTAPASLTALPEAPAGPSVMAPPTSPSTTAAPKARGTLTKIFGKKDDRPK